MWGPQNEKYVSENPSQKLQHVHVNALRPQQATQNGVELEKLAEACCMISCMGCHLALKGQDSAVKESLSEDMLSSIMGIEAHFIPAHPKKALSFLKHLAKVSCLVRPWLLGEKEKSALKGLFKSLESWQRAVYGGFAKGVRPVKIQKFH